MKRHSEKGMALVITLMMLAITTFMAVVFLSLSRRERANVKSVEEQLTSRSMADMALSRAQADLTAKMIDAAEQKLATVSPVFGDTNVQRHIAIANRSVQRALFQYDLRTSKNFINPNGFRRADGNSPWNVNYYTDKGDELKPGSDDYYQNIANLQYDPRVPVIVTDGRTNDFRAYIDLNRNGMFDENIVQDVTGTRNERYSASFPFRETTSGPYLRGRFVGDPEWIGVLERPDLPHSETNRFIGRYAYLMLPTGKSLDINFIHNLAIHQTGTTNLSYDTTRTRYSRNQGVGSWELNLAGFLVDLHTNVWRPTPTFYNYTSTNSASGQAFSDAVGLLKYRLNNSRANLATPAQVFGGFDRSANDLVDMAGDGPIIPYHDWYSAKPIRDFTFAALDNDDRTRFWHGYERVNLTAEYPDVQRYFKLKTPSASSEILGFYQRFTNAMSAPFQSGRTNTYDRYAYYRMLAQMGADSKPALDNKIHLNFAFEPGTISTNLSVTWVTNSINNNTVPTTLIRSNAAVLVRRSDGGEEYQVRPNNLTNFFLIAADAMLRASMVTNIYLDNFGNLRTNYTIGSSYFDNPELNAVWNDPQRARRIVATPVRPDFSITNIQIFHRTNAPNLWRPNDLSYTNNEYSTAVHRVLQLAANIYDNMTNNMGRTGRPQAPHNDPFFPTVFRPMYDITPTNVVIVGWEPQENANLALRHAQTNAALFRSAREYFYNPAGVPITNVSFYGQPWVIGVKKGWPTFNEFSVETFPQITRKLEVIKNVPGEKISLTNYADLASRTRQIFMVGFSNRFGLEAWNSYALTNKRTIRIESEIDATFGIDRVTRRDTNNRAIVLQSQPAFAAPFVKRMFGSMIIPGTSAAPNGEGWPGRQGDMDVSAAMITQPTTGIADGPSDFRVPIFEPITVLTNSEYSDLPAPYGTFFRRPAVWQRLDSTPDLRINITNRVRYLAVDVAENRVIDYATFDNVITSIDLDELLRGEQNAANVLAGAGFDPRMFWNPTQESKSPTGPGLTYGIMRQIEVGLGLIRIPQTHWKNYSGNAPTTNEVKDFLDYMTGVNTNATIATNIARQVPYSPTKEIPKLTPYQANDPLVHFTLADLRNPLQDPRPPSGTPGLEYKNDQLGKRNTARQRPRTDGKHGISFQDPRIFQSDDWQFPIARLDGPGAYGITNFHYRFPNIGVLGQIHRGTPWQTVYLKAGAAPNIDPTTVAADVATWVEWAGSYGTHPTNDWKLIGLFTTAMTENAARGLLSVNQSQIAAWSAVLSGVPMITNSWSDNQYRVNPKLPPKFGVPTSNDDLLVQPGSKQIADIVRNINQYRSERPMRVFSYLGEILGTPRLSIGTALGNANQIQGSPFLNLGDTQIKDASGLLDYHAFTDEALEAIPQRILSLLKEDEPRVTIYCFGQTLKPAPRSFVTSSDFYNLCANYQVTGEYVTKAIVRVDGELDPQDFLLEDSNWGFSDAQRREWKLQRRPFKTVVESFEVLAPFE